MTEKEYKRESLKSGKKVLEEKDYHKKIVYVI